MESNQPSRSNLKRKVISEESDSDSDSGKPTAEKRLRFPKGKKARLGDEAVNIRRAEDDDEIGIGIGLADPHSAAKEREKRRSQRNHDRFGEDGIGEDVSKAEVSYEGLDSENLMEDGIPIEPFNLDKEREEGYFDADGNFVEYAPNEKNQVKDAWLDSVEAGETKLYARKTEDEDGDGDGDGDGEDLPLSDGDDIGKIKRRIANVLEDGETVLQALRRLKGASSSARNKKEKMPAETKRVFDQLTEDAVTLMDKYGEYNVNHEKREIFEREAQGYESLARARSQGAALGTNNGAESAGDEYDMFGEEDEDATAQASNSDGGPSQLENDYLFDESSGYYYSSSLGYYYDPSTGLYCSAASGLWYSFNEETGAYDEITHHGQAAAAADAETGAN
ncbi:hypothetical protein GBA52_017293 [Prunus armeniaca]|nr:hypothetical protein GBA52_017293 [Prunus armeniaca]